MGPSWKKWFIFERGSVENEDLEDLGGGVRAIDMDTDVIEAVGGLIAPFIPLIPLEREITRDRESLREDFPEVGGEDIHFDLCLSIDRDTKVDGRVALGRVWIGFAELGLIDRGSSEGRGRGEGIGWRRREGGGAGRGRGQTDDRNIVPIGRDRGDTA